MHTETWSKAVYPFGVVHDFPKIRAMNRAKDDTAMLNHFRKHSVYQMTLKAMLFGEESDFPECHWYLECPHSETVYIRFWTLMAQIYGKDISSRVDLM